MFRAVKCLQIQRLGRIMPLKLQIHKSHSQSASQKTPMKQLLETIWNFVRKIPKGISKYMRHKKEAKTDAVEKWETSQERKSREKKKRKSFKSFVNEQEEQSKVNRKRSCRHRFKRRAPTSLNEANSYSNLIGQNESSSAELLPINAQLPIHLMRITTSECEQIFQDLNGVQISMINEGRNEEHSEFKESDSQVELIKLISGDREESSARVLTRKFEQIRFQDAFRRKEKLEWWQMIVEGRRYTSNRRSREQPQPPSEPKASHLAHSISNIPISKPSSFNNLPHPPPKEVVHSRNISVLTLIDLTLDQNHPPIYQVPLSVLVYD